MPASMSSSTGAQPVARKGTRADRRVLRPGGGSIMDIVLDGSAGRDKPDLGS
jgi:hypothetical protein